MSQFGEILERARTSVMPVDLAQIRALLQSVLPTAGKPPGADGGGGEASARASRAASGADRS